MAFPSISPSFIDIQSIVPIRSTTTLSGIEQREVSAGQYYVLNLQFNNLSKAEARELMGFYMQNTGGVQSFRYDLPDYFATAGNETNNTTTNGTADAGDTNIDLTAVTGAYDNPAYAIGDYFKFSGHTKLYQLTENIDKSETNMTFYPPLRSAVGSGETIQITAPFLQVRFDETQTVMPVRPDEFASIRFVLREVLQ